MRKVHPGFTSGVLPRKLRVQWAWLPSLFPMRVPEEPPILPGIGRRSSPYAAASRIRSPPRRRKTIRLSTDDSSSGNPLLKSHPRRKPPWTFGDAVSGRNQRPPHHGRLFYHAVVSRSGRRSGCGVHRSTVSPPLSFRPERASRLPHPVIPTGAGVRTHPPCHSERSGPSGLPRPVIPSGGPEGRSRGISCRESDTGGVRAALSRRDPSSVASLPHSG